MENYVLQLIEDMKVSERSINDYHSSKIIEIDDEKSIEDYIMEIEKHFHEESLQTISDIIGLEEVQFPPAVRLTTSQLKAISKSLIKLLKTWCIEVDLPIGLAPDVKYRLLLSVLNRKAPVISMGTLHIELCDYNSKNCPFGEQFCSCKEWEES
jgi:hypothetical protein